MRSMRHHVLGCMVLTAALLGAVSAGANDEFKLDPLPTNASYASADVTYDDGGMGPLNDFARSFINSALPGGFDEDFVQDILDNGFEVSKIVELIKKNIGYVISLAIGFLFVIIFPIVGSCFCCCRLCGNCGGKNVQEPDDNLHCRRRIYTCVMFVITLFILVGNICAYVSNDRLSGALDKIGDTVESNLGDIDEFLDLLSVQINTIGVTNLQKTQAETMKYMNNTNLKKSVSNFILDTLSDGSLNHMDDHIQELGDVFHNINTTSTELGTAYAAMCHAGPTGVCASIPNPVGSGTALYELIHTSIPKFDAFSSSNPTENATTQIENKVASALPNMTNTATSVNTNFNKIGDEVTNIQRQIESFRNDTKSGFDIKSMTKKTRDAADTVKKYDKYRHSAGAGLGAMITIVAVLQFLGVAFGLVGQGTRTPPTDRGCVSNSGGNMLIASVAFIFIFSSLLMLLTTICFALGAVMERFVCQPLSDSDLTLLKVAGNHIPGDLVGNGSFSDIMLQCKEGKTVYEAFPIMKSKFDITNIKDKMDEEKKKMINTTTDSMTNISGSIQNTAFAAQATTNLGDLNDSLSTVNFTQIEQQRSTIALASRISTAQNFTAAMTHLLDLVMKLKQYQTKVGDWSVEFQAGMNGAEAKLSNMTMINKVVHDFVEKVTDPVDKFVIATQTDVETKMGKCTPLWTLYNSIVIVSVCKYTIDAFNGFWFSIGWCLFFFVPGVVVAVKLAKHYRKMEFPDDEEGLALQPVKTNQVAPSD